MNKKIYTIETIGLGLAFLYAISGLVFVQYLNIPELKIRIVLYIVLFGVLCVGALAVMMLKEWGRKLLVAFNAAMLFCLAVFYIPRVDLAPVSYLFLSAIVLLYFTQSNVKQQFHVKKYDSWNRSILVVDDDEGIVKVVRPILLSHGYSVLTAFTGEDGLQIARTQNPDLIILDVILPGIKGREVCQELKADPQTKGIPVVFLTAKDSPEDIQAEKDVGSSAHLTKPVESKTLVETVQRVLDAEGAGKAA